jgi:predicted dehydrogenase
MEAVSFRQGRAFIAVGDSLAGKVQRQAGPAAIIIGAGLMGRHHARAAAAAGASIVAVVDHDREAAALLAASFTRAVAETKLEKALLLAPADVAHVCTPLATHAPLAETIARAGINALIEKPIACTAAEARQIHDSFARSGKLVCPTHQYAFQRSVRDAAAWLKRAGRLRRITFDICSAGAAGGLDPDEVVADILPHPLSMVQKLLPSADVAALDWTCLRPAAGEWVASASLGDAALVIQISMNGRPTRFLTRITADAGSIELDNFHDFSVDWPGTVSRAAKIVQPFLRNGHGLAAAGWNLAARAVRGESAYPGLRTLVSEFYQAAGSDGRIAPPITPEESIAVAEGRDRIVALAAHG